MEEQNNPFEADPIIYINNARDWATHTTYIDRNAPKQYKKTSPTKAQIKSKAKSKRAKKARKKQR
jgi:hypothetical protein